MDELQSFRPRLRGTNLKLSVDNRTPIEFTLYSFRPRLRGTNLKLLSWSIPVW